MNVDIHLIRNTVLGYGNRKSFTAENTILQKQRSLQNRQKLDLPILPLAFFSSTGTNRLSHPP